MKKILTSKLMEVYWSLKFQKKRVTLPVMFPMILEMILLFITLIEVNKDIDNYFIFHHFLCNKLSFLLFQANNFITWTFPNNTYLCISLSLFLSLSIILSTGHLSQSLTTLTIFIMIHAWTPCRKWYVVILLYFSW